MQTGPCGTPYFDTYSEITACRLLLWVCYKNRTQAYGCSQSYFKLPNKRSNLPEMSERLMEVFAVIVTIIVGAGISEMFIKVFER